MNAPSSYRQFLEAKMRVAPATGRSRKRSMDNMIGDAHSLLIEYGNSRRECNETVFQHVPKLQSCCLERSSRCDQVFHLCIYEFDLLRTVQNVCRRELRREGNHELNVTQCRSRIVAAQPPRVVERFRSRVAHPIHIDFRYKFSDVGRHANHKFCGFGCAIVPRRKSSPAIPQLADQFAGIRNLIELNLDLLRSSSEGFNSRSGGLLPRLVNLRLHTSPSYISGKHSEKSADGRACEAEPISHRRRDGRRCGNSSYGDDSGRNRNYGERPKLRRSIFHALKLPARLTVVERTAA